jgi:hypothetical protein
MIISQWKTEDIALHNELLNIIDVLLKVYRRTNDHDLAEEITRLYGAAQDLNHRIETFNYPVEKVSLSHVKRGKI